MLRWLLLIICVSAASAVPLTLEVMSNTTTVTLDAVIPTDNSLKVSFTVMKANTNKRTLKLWAAHRGNPVSDTAKVQVPKQFTLYAYNITLHLQACGDLTLHFAGIDLQETYDVLAPCPQREIVYQEDEQPKKIAWWGILVIVSLISIVLIWKR